MRPLTAASMLLVILTAGCEHSAFFSFQMVDAKTGKGLDNVKIEALLTGHHYGVSMLPADDEVDAKLTSRTDDQGHMMLNLKVEKDLHYYVFLTRPGYQAMTGHIDPFSGLCELKRRPSDTLPSIYGAPHDVPEIHVGPNQTTIIPMWRLESPSQN